MGLLQIQLSEVHWQIVLDLRSRCTEGSVAKVSAPPTEKYHKKP